jgi:hypothetical protein
VIHRFRRRPVQPSPEAIAAIAAADESHKQALADLAAQREMEPAIADVRQKLSDHNEANHWVEWLLGIAGARLRRSA